MEPNNPSPGSSPGSDPDPESPMNPNEDLTSLPPTTPEPTGPVVGGADPSVTTVSSPKRRSPKKLLIIIAVILVIGLGSAAAYVGIILPNTPSNMLKRGFINTLQQPQSSSNGTFSATSNGVTYKGTFSTAENATTKAVDGQLNLTVSGVTFSVETRLVNQNLYIKLGDLKTIAALVNGYYPNTGPLVKSVSSALSNKWIVVDSSLLNGSKGVKCTLNSSWTLTSADIKLVEDQYNQHPFATIQSASSDTVGSQAAEKLVLSIDNATLNSFGNGLQNLSAFKALNMCSSATNKSSSSSSHGQTPLTVWVDKSSKRIVQVAYASGPTNKKNGFTTSVTIKLHYGSVSVAAPTNAIPALQVLTQIENSAKSNPALLNLLSGASPAATTGSTSLPPTH
jgi:hypothetical protein